ncbi:TPA: hypothetical protein IWN08_002515 [Enterococcus faecium]|nr:hypothetical protein [Enterococcus faecium]
MDILVRKIDSKVIAKIDKRCQELTNKTGKKWSRNKYLKVLTELGRSRPSSIGG